MIKKLGLGLSLGLFLIPSILMAQEVNIEGSEQPSIVIPETDIYEVTINKKWTISALVRFDRDNIYIPFKFLPKDLIKNLIITDTKDLIIPRSLISKMNLDTLSLDLNLNDNYFKSVSINFNKDEKSKTSPINAGFINYSFNIPITDSRNPNSTIRGIWDFKWSNKDKWNFSSSNTWNGEQNIRLNTFFQKKLKNDSILTFGDTQNTAISNLNSVNFLGLKLTSSYYNIINSDENYPIIPISGFSVNPSKLDLYLNNNIIQKTEVNAGKYELQHLLQQTGLGVARTYVYDVAGNPIVVDLPFYGSNQIIRKGTDAYDISFGTIRKNYGSKSFEYSDLIVNALYKRGITSNYTQDFFIQATKDFHVASSISHWIPNPYIGKLGLGITMNSENQKSHTLSWERTSEKFALSISNQNGDLFCPGLNQSCFKNRTQINLSTTIPKNRGNINLNYIQRKLYDNSDESFGLSYRKNLSKHVNFNIGVTQNKQKKLGAETVKVNSAYIGLTFSFGGIQTSSNISKRDNNNRYNQTISFSENENYPQLGSGSIMIERIENETDISLYQKGKLSNFEYSIWGNKNSSNQNLNGTIEGSLVFVPEANYLSFNRPINDRFTFVQVDGAEDSVFIQQNTENFKTNKNGYKILKSNFNSEEEIKLDVNKLPKDKNPDQHIDKNLIGFSFGNKANLSIKDTSIDIKISGVEEGTIFNMGDDVFVVGNQGYTSIDKYGEAEIPLKNGKKCYLNFIKGVKKYECN